MNKNLGQEEIHGCLLLLQRGLVLIRMACQANDLIRAEAIADALHNLPHLLQCDEGQPTLTEFRRIYLEPVVRQYPDLAEWYHLLNPS